MVEKNLSRPTLQTVADVAGVSRSLVSLALNGKPGVSDAKRKEIVQIASDLDYKVDPLARELRTGKTRLFGLIVRNVANPFFNDLLSGMQQAALEAGATVVAMDSAYSQERERDHIENLAARRVDSLAIAPVGQGASIAQWRRQRPDGRVVLINSSFDAGSAIPRVAPDGVMAVTLAFDHLWSQGHRSIAFLSAPVGIMADGDRYGTYLSLCELRGVASRPIFTELQSDALVTSVENALQAHDRPTAIITHSDFSAQYVYIAARRCGIRVGQDLAVVGHDDLDTSQLLDPPLSTLRLDRKGLGRAVFSRLSGESDGDHLEPVELIVRSSSSFGSSRV